MFEIDESDWILWKNKKEELLSDSYIYVGFDRSSNSLWKMEWLV
jgi:hypothetical protein